MAHSSEAMANTADRPPASASARGCPQVDLRSPRTRSWLRDRPDHRLNLQKWCGEGVSQRRQCDIGDASAERGQQHRERQCDRDSVFPFPMRMILSVPQSHLLASIFVREQAATLSRLEVKHEISGYWRGRGKSGMKPSALRYYEEAGLISFNFPPWIAATVSA